MRDTMTTLIMLSGADFSSADLSTPRGALMHFRDILCAGFDRKAEELALVLFDIIFKEMDSGQYSPDQVQAFHYTARQACTYVHRVVEHLKVSREENLMMHAQNLRRVIAAGAMLTKLTMYGETANTKQMKDILEAIDQKGGDSCEIVD